MRPVLEGKVDEPEENIFSINTGEKGQFSKSKSPKNLALARRKSKRASSNDKKAISRKVPILNQDVPKKNLFEEVQPRNAILPNRLGTFYEEVSLVI